ncbi:hypothetical protein HHK36_015618 [Tetracentron sinense]|uniref:G-patch domain-containing protein n=1 Tax=Tetracentron sinense TaxID=13715 RepID=A0A834Z5G3_TETSI|nr:hypothetical protein HHK36_015618 [Tetracentron sinense]
MTTLLAPSSAAVDFITTPVRDGTTAVEMASITNSRMGVMCSWNLMRGGILNSVNSISFQGDQSETYLCEGTVLDDPIQEEPCFTEGINSNEPENPPPPSEWLEDTLINLYLTGYSNPTTNAADDLVMPLETDGGGDNLELSVHGKDDTCELEEGEWIPEDLQDATESSGSILDEGASWDEENWRAQYGQVLQPGEEVVPDFPVVDLWDWAMITEITKKKKHQVARLVGRLVRRSTKLHPSMPSGGGLLKTAAIYEVHLDLVRVASGQVYRLRSPSARYLASLSTYDSSNPTKDWGFPELLVDKQNVPSSHCSGSCESETPDRVLACKDSSASPDQLSVSEKHRSRAYRDRAAERRALHGGFGVGPGQKELGVGDAATESSPVYDCPEGAAAEALTMSFGAGSYARRLLEGMGWKEGEALGKTTKGLKEPLEAIGNKGYAGLGWDQGRPKHY